MRTGWTDKLAAPVLRVKERKVSQSLVPAFRKIALLMRIDALRTWKDIMAEMEELEPMSDAECDLRERIFNGTANQSEAHKR